MGLLCGLRRGQNASQTLDKTNNNKPHAISRTSPLIKNKLKSLKIIRIKENEVREKISEGHLLESPTNKARTHKQAYEATHQEIP